MKSKKHILLLTPGFPQNEDDSSCIPPLQALVHELHSRYESDLLINVVAFQYPFLKGNYTWNGVRCWSAAGKNIRFPGKFLTWIQIAVYIMKLHKKQKIDVVHAFWLHDCTLIGQWMSKLTGSKFLAHLMGQDALKTNLYIRFFDRSRLRVIANSAFSSQMLNQEFNIPSYRIVPFGINPDDFEGIPDSPRRIDLLAVGSLTDVKNHVLFIEIFAALRKVFPVLNGSIIGDGPLAESLRERINAYGLENCLLLEGAKSRKEVLIRMSESKILLHTAPFESAGYVFLEALHIGMKVICFRTGFLPDVAGAFPCNDKQEMLLKLQKLLSEKQEYHKVGVPLISDTVEAIFNVYEEH